MLSDRLEDVIQRGLPYLINTLFDSVFTILGIVVGSGFGSVFDMRAVVGTLVTASISLGVSSGFSVYEAESLQEEKRLDKVEEAMITNLEHTIQSKESRLVTIIASVVVFLTPLGACLVTLVPFLLIYTGVLGVNTGITVAVLFDLVLLFAAGLVFGGEKRLLKGVRMTVLGALIFLVGYVLNNLFF